VSRAGARRGTVRAAAAGRERAAATAVDRQLGQLIDRYGLHEGAKPAFGKLLELVATDSLAPTTVREAAAAVDEHLADSLVALELPAVSAAREIADLGAGAGFPGLPLALALPGAAVELVESNGRKCEFIERARDACGAANASVVNRRAEDWPEGIARFDLVTARAVAVPAVVAEYAAPLLAPGGTLVIWRGRRDPDAERAAEAAAAILGLEVAALTQVHPFKRAQNRYLYVMSKVRETPARFPRRAGIAQKRPLGAEFM
jgi:16S rRNA (guanine527-N7)-methyltransferase